MIRANETDFYFGAALSILDRHGVSISLNHIGEGRRLYNGCIDGTAHVLFMKYRAVALYDSDQYASWQFSFSDDELLELEFLKNQNYKMVLICGKNKVNLSEIIIMDKEDVNACLLDPDKCHFTVGRRKFEKAYRIFMGKNREYDRLIYSKLGAKNG